MIISQTEFIKAKGVSVAGATSPEGIPFVRVTASGLTGWIPLAEFVGSATAARDRLVSGGIVLLGDDWVACMKAVQAVEHFPPQPLLVHPGWTGEHFALPSGEVFSPPGARQPKVLFETDARRCSVAGSLAEWRRSTAVLRDQLILTFVVMTSFAPAILRFTDRMGNFGFELTGDGGVGKSTAQALAASVIGPTSYEFGRNYITSANTTMNALDGLLEQHSDAPLIIDDLTLFAADATPRKRAFLMNELVFRLAEGSRKSRHQDPAGGRSRFLFLTSANVALAEELADHRPAVADAAADRLLTIPLAKDRPHGLFDSLPEGFASSGDLAAHIQKLIRRHHGKPIRRFLSRLVVESKRDRRALRLQIRDYVRVFRAKSGVDPNDGSALRVADAFALVYAAGRLAVRYRALSPRMRCGPAALAAYRLHVAARRRGPTPLEQFLAIARHPDVLRIPLNGKGKGDAKARAAAPGYILERRTGDDEFVILAGDIERIIPGGKGLLDDPQVRALLKHDKDRRRQTKRQLWPGEGHVRVYAFKLPQDAF